MFQSRISNRPTSNNNYWLKMKNIEAYLDGNRVFNDLNLRIKLGQNTVILGPNGSGKTTLLKLISRDIYPIVKSNSMLSLFGSEIINNLN